MLFSQTRRRGESPTTIAHIIPSLDSDSPFRRGPLVDLQRAEDLGTSSIETTNTSKRNLTGTSTIPQIIERGGTLTSAEEKLNLFSVTELQKSEISAEILNLNLQVIDPKNVIPVGGRIKYFIKNWQRITKDAIILSTVQGVSLDWTSYPVQEKIPHPPKLNSEQEKILQEEITSLVQKEAVVRVAPNQNQFISNMFTVPKKDGGYRPIINLKPLNRFLLYQHFKMEGLFMVQDLIERNCYMCKIDLKDAYLTVPIIIKDQKFLRFLWRQELYQFQTLPFGLASAPRIFTKLMKPVVGLLRRLGVKLIIYLDDILILSRSKEKLVQSRNTTLFLLQMLGFMINWKKSMLDAVQVISFLGFEIDSVNMLFKLPEGKVQKIKDECKRILKEESLSVREMSQLIGKLISTMQAVIPAKLQCRFMQMTQIKGLLENKHYEAMIPISVEVKTELRWWINQLEVSNGKSIIGSNPSMILTSDASDVAWGATWDTQSTGGCWSPVEQSYHINAKELLAAFLALQSFAKSKRNIQILIKLDNVTAVAHINRMGGTKSKLLNHLVKQIWDWCQIHQISLVAEFIPGALNIRADWESRNQQDSGDWMLDKSVFSQIMNLLGGCKVDLFASRLNHQLPQYFSWRADPGAMGINAFHHSWKGMKAYMFPPFTQIGKCLSKIREEQIECVVLITPVWQAQTWYPLLLEMLIQDSVLLPPYPNLLTSPIGLIHPLTANNSLYLAAWKISGNPQKQILFQKRLPLYTPKHGDQELEQLTRVPGESGLAGVVHSHLIQFIPLWNL